MGRDSAWRPVRVPLQIVCLAVVLTSTLTTVGRHPPVSALTPVTAGTLLCPDLGLDGHVSQLLDLVRGSGPGGSVRPARGPDLLGGDRQHDEALFLPPSDPAFSDPASSDPARTGELPRPLMAAGGPLRLAASGPAAAGLTATVTSPGSGAGPLRARCEQPRPRTWFAGPSTVAGRDPILYWTNPGPRAGRVDVGVSTPDGAARRTEITIPPGQTVSRRLAELAPEATSTAVDVQTVTGRVLCWLVDRASGTAPRQAAPVPPTAGPAARVLVGGLLSPVVTAGEAGRPPAELVLAAPGAAVTARVTVLTRSGRHVPVGLEAVRIPAGTTVRRPVTLPAGAPSALLVESAGGSGVVAALAAPTGAESDAAWVAASVPERPRWEGLAVGAAGASGPTPPEVVVAAAPVPRWSAGALVLVAPDRAATAWVDGTRYEVGAGRAVLAPLPAGRLGARVVGTGGTLVATQVLGRAPSPGDLPGLAADLPPAGAAAALPAPVPWTVSAVVGLGGSWRFRAGPAPQADLWLLRAPSSPR
ncbi:DUF5719 family protein [Frankia sp. EI5c]|uniref:DUF5719 family protein n=1 Tax=Frankia sp. EI5c TaxID=683316 RepID=UPI000825DB55|nr:DUF5719 family protein [Frankia sp. EI5c]